MALKSSVSRLISKQLKNVSVKCVRHKIREHDMTLNISLMNDYRSTHIYIEAISSFGFRLNNNIKIVGPMIAFPKTLLQWNVNTPEEFTMEAFSLFPMLEPKLDLLIIGVGDQGRKANPKAINFLKAHKINVEILSTSQAIGLYNYLNQEDRFLAAALIPPQNLPNYMAEDLKKTKKKIPETMEWIDNTYGAELLQRGQRNQPTLADFDDSELVNATFKRRDFFSGINGNDTIRNVFKETKTETENMKKDENLRQSSKSEDDNSSIKPLDTDYNNDGSKSAGDKS